MTDRERLLLAFGIVEYATAVDHLEALNMVGLSTPGFAVADAMQVLDYLALQWDETASSLSHIVAEARAYTAAHLAEIEDLLRENGATNEHIETIRPRTGGDLGGPTSEAVL